MRRQSYAMLSRLNQDFFLQSLALCAAGDFCTRLDDPIGTDHYRLPLYPAHQSVLSAGFPSLQRRDPTFLHGSDPFQAYGHDVLPRPISVSISHQHHT